jgi:hypothetical protein
MPHRVGGDRPNVPRFMGRLTRGVLVSLRDEIDRQRPTARVMPAGLRAEINQLLDEGEQS